MAESFAEKYPDVAGRLLLEPNKCEDPHVERIIEAFAMLSARVHLRLDDDFSEVSDSLLEILYPNYLRPIPSATVVQFSLDPEQGAPAEGVRIDRHSPLRSKPVDGVRCTFRTCYPLRLFPIEVKSVDIQPVSGMGAVADEARSMLRIRIEACAGSDLSDFEIGSIPFFLSDQGGSLQVLHEMFLRDPVGLQVRWGSKAAPVVLPPEFIKPMGFERDDSLLEYPPEAFVGYRLLQEYFSFPDKFLFVNLTGLDRAPRPEHQDHLELSVLLRQSAAAFEVRFGPEHLQLNCAPAVNLFSMRADPIRLTQTAVEYPVTPDVRSYYSYEVYSIDDVTSSTPGSAAIQRFQPFYAVRHGTSRGEETAFWHSARRPSMHKDDSGTDVVISLVDPAFHPVMPPTDVLHIETLCTNRDLPARLPFNDPKGDFQMEGLPEVTSIRCLRKPSAPLRAPSGRDARWRIISHLALNYLSLGGGERSSGREAEAGPALDALREILKIYDFRDSPTTRQRIAGIVGLGSRKVLRRSHDSTGSGFARGTEVTLEFDADQYTGTGVFLFASVLERFLGLYTTVNSFTQTVAQVRGREEILKRWPPRAGDLQLL
jgi:type VI secretion system protein ImpG